MMDECSCCKSTNFESILPKVRYNIIVTKIRLVVCKEEDISSACYYFIIASSNYDGSRKVYMFILQEFQFLRHQYSVGYHEVILHLRYIRWN